MNDKIRRKDITADMFFADVTQWRDVVLALRGVMLGTGLTETSRWGSPCYQADGRNIALIGTLKANAVLSFFKGAIIPDPAGPLHMAGPNSQVGAMMRFTSVEQVAAQAADIAAYVQAAVDVERSGAKVPKPLSTNLVYPEELLQKFDELPEFYEAFHALTPGRRRAYNMHFSDAKQSATRLARIEKHLPRILQGLGLMDR